MKRIFEPAAYAAPENCWWDDVPAADWTRLGQDSRCEVLVIGGGFTGLVAALSLAKAGVDTVLIEAERPGFGASGRNGGFCCLGGAKASAAQITRMVGAEGLRAWRQTEIAAVDSAAGLILDHGLDVDRHSQGETLLAHTPAAWAEMQAESDDIQASYGLTPSYIPESELRNHGLGGPFHGAMTLPKGFALHPRKYHNGLSGAATQAGARLFAFTAALSIKPENGGWVVHTPQARVHAKRVILATNGYSSEDVPPWLRARYLPVQSSVVVTRPLTATELKDQGWSSDQMAYDSRFLLHYFRLMPDRRFLFGMRGGLRATRGSEFVIRRKIRKDLETMFPGFAGAEQTHFWSGLVCLTARLAPYCGPVPEMPGIFAGFGFHGNGVAMGSHTGRILADLAQDRSPDAAYPELMKLPPRRFPLGSARRWLLAPAYALAEWRDT